jgi:hypothetical protein
MTKCPNDEKPRPFGLRASSFLRHSGFDIRPFDITGVLEIAKMIKHLALAAVCLLLPASGSASAADGSVHQLTVTGKQQSAPRGYVPPVLGNGNLCLQVDYEGCQSQRAYAKMIPGILWAGRRYGPPGDQLVPFGHFEQALSCDGKPCRTPSSWQQTLNTKDALTDCQCDYGDSLTVQSTVFVPLAQDLVAVKKRFVSKDQAAHTVRIEFNYLFSPPGKTNQPPRRVTMTPQWKADSKSLDVAYHVDGYRACDGVVSVLADGPVTPRIDQQTFSLAADLAIDAASPKEITFYLVFADSLDGKDYQQRMAQLKSLVRAQGFAGLLETHKQQWASYWDESYVRVPDQPMEKAYYTSQYHLRTNATKWSFPVALFNTHWAGRFFGWDEMFAYLGMASSNHLSVAKRVPDFRYAVLNRALQRTAHYGHPEAYGARYPWETLEDGGEGAPPGFWIEHIFHMANIALSSWYQYLYTGDLEWLKTAGYPVIKECANFYFAQTIYQAPNGSLIVGKCTDLERLGPAKLNPFMTSCGVIFTLEAASKAAGLLHVDQELAASWKDAAEKLRQSLPHNGERYIPYAGCKDESIAVLGGLFPYPVFDAQSSLQKNAVYWFVREGIRFGNMYPVGKSVCAWYGGWMATALAALGDKQETVKLLSQVVDGTGCFSEIFEINEEKVIMRPWFSTAEGNFVYALNQMLLQSRDQEVLIAPAVPEAWNDFSFKLPCYGNLVATVSAKGGRLVELTLTPGDANQTLRRTLVIPSRLVDERTINKAAVTSMTTQDGCHRLDVQLNGPVTLLRKP